MNWIAIADMVLTVIDRATEEVKKNSASAEGSKSNTVDKAATMITAVIIIIMGLLGKRFSKKKSSIQTSTEEIVYSGTSEVSMPVEGKVVVTEKFGIAPTSYRNHTHRGIDIRANNSKLLATENDGNVVAVGSDPVSGNFVSIEYEHPDGNIWRITYCHLSKPLVKVGDKVSAGQVIGISGNTGSSTAPHLHLTVKKKKKGSTEYELVDPLIYLQYLRDKGSNSEVEDRNGNEVITQASNNIPVLDYNPPTLKKNTNAQGVARRTKNPGNMTGNSPFGTGELYTHPKTGLKFTVFESFTKGYAGNAWRLLQYMGGKTRYLPKNPSLRQLVRVWVGTDDNSELMKRARDAGISDVEAKLPITFNVVLAILLALGKYDSSYCVPEEAKSGLLLAWSKWLQEGNVVDEGGSTGNILINTNKTSELIINNETNRRQ